MKKVFKLFTLAVTLLFIFLCMSGFTYAKPDDSSVEPNAVSRISITVDRTTSTHANITASGSTSSIANSLVMTATLYEDNSGTLTPADASPVKKTIKNCINFNFDISFDLRSNKSYKVKVVLTDVTNGVTTTTSKTSNSF